MVEKGFVTEQNFREFTVHQCRNAAHTQQYRLLQGVPVADELGLEKPSPAAAG
jgi:hypothetical protein